MTMHMHYLNAQNEKLLARDFLVKVLDIKKRIRFF